MSARSLTAEDRAALEAIGRRRTHEALLDLEQLHLDDFGPGGDER